MTGATVSVAIQRRIDAAWRRLKPKTRKAKIAEAKRAETGASKEG